MEGTLAVNLFMAISGFVIFMLLDRQGETYRQFICRRFFRLYPLYLILFVCAIPLSRLEIWTFLHGHQYYLNDTERMDSAWRHWQWNILLHLGMAQGLPPDAWLGKYSMEAFLVPAWSISLEWQFYLVAPVAFIWTVGTESLRRAGLCLLCAGLFWAGQRLAWNDGFLPLHPEFFVVGAVSYFAYKFTIAAVARAQWRNTALPLAVVFAAIIFGLGGKSRPLIPICFWLVFFAVLVEPENSFCGKWLRPAFTLPAMQFLGKISYSIYLSHYLILIIAQALLLRYLPDLSRPTHFWTLLALTVPVTVALSTLLYRFIEVPGMSLGKQLSGRWKVKPTVLAAVAVG